MKFLVYLMTMLFVGSAIAQNPTILQGSYISNVFGNSNFVKNPNGQTNVANVTTVTATVTRSTTTPLVATSEFTVAIGTANGTATWATRAFDAGMKGQNCEARFSYRGFAATSKVHIKQGANTVASLNLTPATDPRIASINFPCGDLSTATTFQVTDTAILAGTNEIGGIYVGLATNMANVAQAEALFTARGNAGQTLSPFGAATIIFNTVTLDSENGYNAATGVYTVKKPGRYIIFARVSFSLNSWDAGNGNKLWVRKNGVISGTTNWSTITESRTLSPQITHTVDVIAGDTLTISMYQNTSGNKIVDTSTDVSEFNIARFPSSSELVVTPERQNTWGGVVYDDSTQNQFFGIAEPTAFTSYNNATWNKPTNLKGKASVTTTNTGNDLGFSVDQLPVGNYKVTLTNGFYTAPGFTDGDNAICVFRVRETTTNTIIGRIQLQAVRMALSNVTQDGFGVIDGVFTQTSLGQRNFILEASKTGDSSASNFGQCVTVANTSVPNILSFTIIPLDQPSNSALYVQGPVKAAATGAAIPEGYVGYVQEAIRTSDVTLSAAAGTYNDVTGLSITLDPGVWEIEAQGQLYVSGAAGVSPNGRLGSWQITDNAGTPNVQREVLCGFTNGVVGTSMTTCRINLRLLVTTTTVYKVRAALVENSGATTNPASVQVNATSNRVAYIRAVRIN